MHFVTDTYEKTALPLLSSAVQKTYLGAIRKHLAPVFGNSCLRDLTPVTMQTYFSGLHVKGVKYPTIVKTRDALSSILRAAVVYEFLQKNPIETLQLPPDKRGTRTKPWISPAQFAALIELIPEPYATMIFVAVWTGLRISEIAGLKWRCIHSESITVEQRYCRGDWSCTKTPGSAATVAVDAEVIERIHRLKTLTVDVRAGRAVRHHKVVKASGPDDLVFQSIKDGKPMNDGNVLKRHIKPAARCLGLKVTWRSAAYLVRDLDGAGGSRPEIGAGTDAAFAHLDHHGHLRAVRPRGTEAGGQTASSLRGAVCSKCSVSVPITQEKSTVKRARNLSKSLKDLVELGGLEPPTSSLRTMRSPN